MILKINDYRMKDGQLVRISEVLQDGGYRVESIILQPDDSNKVVVGDSGFAWPASNFSPITDPKMIAAARAFEANRQFEELDKALDAAWAEVLKWNGVLQCIYEAEQAQVAA